MRLLGEKVKNAGAKIYSSLSVTDVTQGRVLRLRLWDLLRWMLVVNSTVLSDGKG